MDPYRFLGLLLNYKLYLKDSIEALHLKGRSRLFLLWSFDVCDCRCAAGLW